MADNELKKCRCGATPILWVDHFDPVDFGYISSEYQVSCPNCHLEAEYDINRESAIKKWNQLISN